MSSRFSFADCLLTRDEAVFGSMKVFMLEHGQAHDDSAEEVFRDRVVGQLMDDLLAPFTLAASSAGSVPPSSPVIPSPPSQPDLEQVAVRFLGTGTPFYQTNTTPTWSPCTTPSPSRTPRLRDSCFPSRLTGYASTRMLAPSRASCLAPSPAHVKRQRRRGQTGTPLCRSLCNACE
ncbi:hypothetical protein B0H11DRAFT_2214793 [Mycena galericulata]|nr:hypothetical protein B0H11DRAFT_2214793 [Mycena galericulata]